MGADELQEHKELVSLIGQYHWDNVILVGKEFKEIHSPYMWFEDATEAAVYIKEHIPADSAILIKGSRGSRMELLLAKGYEVHGIVRRASTFNTERLDPIYAEVRQFHTMGGQLLFGTDVGYMTDYTTAGEFQGLMKSGLGPMDILRMLTTAPAERFGDSDVDVDGNRCDGQCASRAETQ